jgi:hypothetical protein
MAGGKWAQRIYLGREATAGTAVPATTVWRGEGGQLEDMRETNVVPELIGVPMPSSRTYAGKLGGQLAMASTPATPEQLPHLLEAAVAAVVTGVADGSASSGYVYEYAMSASSVNTIKTYTIETGDNAGAEEMAYSFVQQLTLEAVAGQAVMMSANWVGREVEPDSFTTGLTAPTVSHLLAANSTLAIDDDDDGFGTTPLAAGNLLSWKLTFDTGWRGKWTVDSGELYFHFAYFDRDSFNAVLELKWEHDTAAIAEKAKWRADATRLVRIEVTGDAYATAGTGTELGGKGLRIDFPGRYTKFNALDSEDGNSIVVATLQGGYDEVSGEVLAFLVANEIAVLP